MNTNNNTQDRFMKVAFEQALKSHREGGIPIGSAIVHEGKIVAAGHNRRIQKNSVVLHAEMDALENLGRQTPQFYRNCQLITTLSPCSMCSGAILLYGIPSVVIGENQTFVGEEKLLESRGVKIEVLDSAECHDLLQKFIAEHPDQWHEDISRLGSS